MKKKLLFLAILGFIFSFNVFSQKIIPVAAGPGAISAAYASADAGDVLELTSDGGIYVEPARLTIDKALTIRAAVGLSSKPTWASDDPNYMIKLSAGLTLQGIAFDGLQGASKSIGALDIRLVGGNVKIYNCDFVNMSDPAGTDGKAIYGTSAAQTDSLIIVGCTFANIVKQGILFEANTTQPGAVKYVSIENSTFNTIGAEALYIDDADDNLTTPGPILVMNHVTLHNTSRILTHKSDYNIIRNTIFTNTPNIGNNSYYIYGDNSYVTNSLWFNASVNMHTGKALNMVNADPGYADAANGDFSLSASSPAYNVGDDGNTIGDPRWWPKLSNAIYVEAGKDKISAAIAASNPGDVIELVTDGGLYEESATLTIRKNITIKGSAALVNKPVWTSDDGGYLIRSKADINLTGIVLDGSKGVMKSVGGIAIDSIGYSIRLTNCDFVNFINDAGTDGHAITDGIYSGQIDSLLIKGCVFKNIRKEGIYIAGHNAAAIGNVKYFHVTNSTFSKISSDAIYVRDHDGADATPGPEYLVDHCTFYDCFASYGVLAHHIDGAIIKNCIAYSSTNTGTAYYIYGNNSMLKNSLYFNLGINLHTSQSISVINADPIFVDAANGNFKLYKNSPAVNFGDDGTTIGDPRWGVSNIVANQLILIKKAYSMSPTETSVRIVWQTPESASPASVVQYGTTKALGSTIVGSDGWLISGEGYMHEVTLTGLQPFTKYFYRVGNGTEFALDTNMTKTAPAKGTDFRLMSVSDIHSNDEGIWHGISSKAVRDTTDMTVFIGDFVNDGSIRTEWDGGFFTPGEPLLRAVPVISSVGNHETAFGPSTYYDYFSLPTHPDNGEDPEAYFSMNYGDVKIIAINSTGNYSPAFNEGSLQLAWLDDQIKNADSKWIFIFSHTNVISTSYHAQWSADEKAYLMPLYEKYAAEGKHILVFAGDEHNFEHLYKAGVNYIRPGAANASLRNTDINLVDKPYSLYFNKISGYSTIDVSDNGDLVTLMARDTAGAVYYSTTFTTSSTPAPTIFITEPNGIEDVSDDSFKIQWVDSDPDNDAKISLFYTTDVSIPGTLIAENISEDDPQNYLNWDVSHITPGSYWIYAIITDGVNPEVKKFSQGQVTVVPDATAPPSVTDLSGSVIENNKVVLTWKNPTDLIHVENSIATFEDGFDGFIESPHGTSTGSLESIEGNIGKGMRINYQIKDAWDQYAGVKVISGYPNYSTTPFLEFWYRGDGSSRSLRLIAEQDNDRNGTADDWWYIEAQTLESTEWQHAVVDLRTLSPLSWHPNGDKTFDLENMASLDFIIPSEAAASGHLDIDELKLTGEIYPAPDFEGVILLRRSDRFPQDVTDGDVIYQGKLETFTDATANINQTYYYTIFAFDEVPNYAVPGSSAQWKSPLLTGLKDGNGKSNGYELNQNYPNPAQLSTKITYNLPVSGKVVLKVFNIFGKEVTTLVDQEKSAGSHDVNFNTSTLASGIYYVRMQAGSFDKTRKMILAK